MLTYKLDYSIERDTDRLKAVSDIIDRADQPFRNKDLELMANYILYGKDENGKNAMQRKEVLDGGRRHASFAKKYERESSLDELMETDEDTQRFRKIGEKNIYKIAKTTIDPEDSALPGMADLQESIARLDHAIKVAEGKAERTEEDRNIESGYQLYLLKHILIDMRRHQYYIKDAFKPVIKFKNVDKPERQRINWGGPLHMAGGNTVEFDFENYKHVASLIRNYEGIYEENYEDPLSWGRALIFDFDKYVKMADLSPEKLLALQMREHHASAIEIKEALAKKYGKDYTTNYISLLLSEKIPRQIAAAAAKHRMNLDKNMTRVACEKCGAIHPDDSLFFKYEADGTTICKECAKKWHKNEPVCGAANKNH